MNERSKAIASAPAAMDLGRAFATAAASIGVQFLAERERWFLWLPVLLGLGIGIYFALPRGPAVWHGPLALVSFVALSIVLRRWPAGCLSFGAMAALVAGFTLADLRTRLVAAPVLEKRTGAVDVEGRIAAIAELTDGRRLAIERPVIGRLASENTPERIRITLRARNGGALHVGDRVRVRAVLMPPPAPAAPGAFDFGRRAWFQGLGAVGYATGAARVVTTAASIDDFSIDRRIAHLRAELSGRIRQAVPGPSGAIAAALMTGDRGAIPQPILDDLRASGLAHLLAISGLHIGLVASVLFFGLRAALALSPWVALNFPIKKIAAVAALSGAFAYLLLTGATVPTQRAFLMVALVLLAVLTDRRALSMRTVAWAALVILLVTPESLLSVSFQMSFAAVIALIAVYEWAGPRLARWRHAGSLPRIAILYLFGIAVTTLVAGTATMPFAAFHFNQISHYGLAANVIAVPLMALWIMPWAVVGYAVVPFGWEWLPLTAMAWGVTGVIEVAAAVADWPGSVSRLPAAPPLALVGVAVGGLWLCLWKTIWRWTGAVLILVGIIAGLQAEPPDLMIDDRGRMAAFRTDAGELIFNVRNTTGFTAESWLRRAGTFEAGKGEAFNCDRLGCAGERAGLAIAYVRDARALSEDCRRADILLSAVPVRRRCPSARVVIDRFDLWREGAHALWFNDAGLMIKTVAEARGQRPWAKERGQARWRKGQ